VKPGRSNNGRRGMDRGGKPTGLASTPRDVPSNFSAVIAPMMTEGPLRQLFNAVSNVTSKISAMFPLEKTLLHKLHSLLLLHPFNGLFSGTTWVSRYLQGKTSLDLNEARDDGVWGCSGISWTICEQSAPRFRQTTTPTLHRSILLAGCSS